MTYPQEEEKQTPFIPYNQEAEQSLLGCLLVSQLNIGDICAIIDAESFYIPVHGEIFAAIEDAVTKGKTPSPVLLKSQFDNHHDLKQMGGGVYLAELAGSIVSTVNAIEYAKTIKELHDRRIILEGFDYVRAEIESLSPLERGKALEMANAELSKVIEKMPSRRISAFDAIDRAITHAKSLKSGEIQPTHTHIDRLDQAINGIIDGHLYIIAGRPGMGKTALALNIADQISSRQLNADPRPCQFFSIEMPADKLGLRLLSGHAGVEGNQISSTTPLHESAWQAIDKAHDRFKEQPLVIEDGAGVTVFDICSKARDMHRKYGDNVLFIDYLQLIKPKDPKQPRVYQIQDITQALKHLAKELNIPIFLLSQLSRGVESRDDKRPMISDLRDSGAIEQDGDVIMFPYRHEYYMEKQQPIKRENETHQKYESRLFEWQADYNNAKGKAEIIIGKNKHGTCNTVHLYFSGTRQLFHDDHHLHQEVL